MKVLDCLFAAAPVALAIGIQCGSALGDEIGCRTVPPSKMAGSESPDGIAVFKRDIDGDGVADQLRLQTSSGGGVSSTQGVLTRSTSGVATEISRYVSFSSMVNIHVVPSALTGADQVAARRFVEDGLFGRICDAPDPSLLRLLDIDNTLVWHEGKPMLPGRYTIYFPEAPVGLIPFIGAWSELGLGSEQPFAVWVEYPGDTHAPTNEDWESNTSLLDSGFEVLAMTPRHRVLGTRHGVAAIDIATDRYAWLYVFRERHDLRRKSIESAMIDGSKVAIGVRIDSPGAREAGTITVDLFEGGYTEAWQTE